MVVTPTYHISGRARTRASCLFLKRVSKVAVQETRQYVLLPYKYKGCIRGLWFMLSTKYEPVRHQLAWAQGRILLPQSFVPGVCMHCG